MKNLLTTSFPLFSSLFSATAYTVPKPTGVQTPAARAGPPVGESSSNSSNRRAFLSNIATTATSAITSSSIIALNPNRATAATTTEDAQENVYFGVGCFWHVQHEFIAAEQTLLGRKDNEVTSLTGYAGGLKADKEGRVCYHNFQSIADYGKLGHGEVVGMTIPSSTIRDFAVEYFKLFGDVGERVDTMDKGGEYRSLLGLPGGRKHPMYDQVEAAARDRGMTLEDGKGNDPDTLGKRIVYVMDTKKFPFYQAEVYHQYHNDFLSDPYGKQYNDLADVAVADGRIQITGCPDRVHQIKTMAKQNENIILGSIGVATVALILCVMYMLWMRPRFLYMPIYENYEKDSGETLADGTGTEMVDG